jgi:hypothetical protein
MELRRKRGQKDNDTENVFIAFFHLAQDRGQRRPGVNTVMNFGFHKRWGISWLAEWLSASQEGLCFMELVISLSSYLPENTPHPSYKDQSVYV